MTAAQCVCVCVCVCVSVSVCVSVLWNVLAGEGNSECVTFCGVQSLGFVVCRICSLQGYCCP